MVFRELAGFAGWTLKKLKRRGRERRKEEERGRERKREEKRGGERRGRDKETKDEGRKGRLLKHECS